MLVNEGLPNYLVKRRSLAALRPARARPRAILGMTFKAESDDPRDSLSFKLKKSLRAECRDVLCTDPFLADDGLLPLEDVLERADILFIATPHRAYREADYRGKPVVDIWNVTDSGMSVL